MTSRTQSSCIEAEKAMKLKVAMNETSTPPKITYFTLPESRPEPPGMATPPLRPPGAVPFLWEEAPGKPKAKRELREVRLPPRPVIKSLQPPPRKVAEMKGAINVTSPTTVLDGPYVLKTSNKSSFQSSSFRFLSGSSNRKVCEDDEVVSEKRKEGKEITEVTISRMMRRNRSLTSMSLHSSSHLWACISGGMKHWPWKRNHKA
ncbi:hypothetical protein IHE45_20G072600 [Dioscorea alata]|uniref:Uncharacterized protein n=1 Tax=Dioscorea alata TaxID=55571 RepID=A0ACB7TW51_DIOAL|nr:hypothetical protein IHE45_20G072600 [Dioscorea alata]